VGAIAPGTYLAATWFERAEAAPVPTALTAWTVNRQFPALSVICSARLLAG